MAQTAIGRAALILGLDASALKSGFHSIKAFVRSNMADLTSVAKTAGELVTKGAVVGLAGLGAAGAAGMAGFIAATHVAQERIEELNKVAKAGAAFGLGTSEGTGLFGLMASAGSDFRDASEGLVTLGQRVRDAMSGSSKEATDLFAGLNVEAQKFQGLNPADQFYLLVDSLSKVPDPATRVGLLLKAVGEDTGKNLMPLLGRTGEEARRMAAGFAVSAGEMSRMAAASNAVSALENTFGRVKNKLAVAASPFIEAVATSLNRIDVEGLGKRFERMYAIATDIFKRVSDYASDQFTKLSADLDNWLTKTVAPMVKPGSDPKGNPAVSEFARSVAEFGKSVGQFAGATVDRVSAGLSAIGGVRDWLISKGARVGRGLGFFDEKWGKELERGFGKSAQRLFKESEDAITANTGDKWAKVGERLGLQAGTAAAQVIDRALTPQSRAAQVAIDMGLAAIEGAEAALNKVEDALPTGSGKGSTENTAYRAGTAEELSYRLKQMNSATPEIAKQQLAETRKQSKILADNAAAIKRWLDSVEPIKVAN